MRKDLVIDVTCMRVCGGEVYGVSRGVGGCVCVTCGTWGVCGVCTHVVTCAVCVYVGGGGSGNNKNPNPTPCAVGAQGPW